MKIIKSILAIIFFLLTKQVVFCQNTYPYPSTGNVGIGTTSPLSKFHVYGGDATLWGISLGYGTSRAIITTDDNTKPIAFQIAGSEKMTISTGGAVGIGTTTPSSHLDISRNTFGVTQLTISNTNENSGNYSSYWKDGVAGNVDGQTRVLLKNPNAGTGFVNGLYLGLDQAFAVKSYTIGSKDATPLAFYTSGAERLKISSAGVVSIGTSCAPSGYALAVKGKIIGEEITVKLEGGNCWADYVFEHNYDLKPLSDLERFIKENKHLPEIPSAAEVKADGINLGEMDALLLKKIEELTLYMIEMKKENEKLQEKILLLEKK